MKLRSSNTGLLERPIKQIALELRAGGVSAASLVNLAIERIEAAPSAFLKVYAQAAREAAAESDRRLASGQARSLLEGVPVSIKDLFDVGGDVTTAGSVALRSHQIAKRDAPTISNLRAAGAILMGRTHMSEFAFTGLGDNPHYPKCGNPHDAERVCGGSSSGAAASVGLQQVALGLGTDTGGSVRIPASFCGLVGFKPTQSRVSRDGAFVLSPSQDSIGPIARRVECCVIADGVISGGGQLSVRQSSLKGIRLAVPQDFVLDSLEPAVALAFEATLSRLSAQGVVVEFVRFSHFAEVPEVFARGTIVNAEAFAHHSELGLLQRRELYDPSVLARIDIGGRMTADDLQRLFRVRTRMIEMTHEISRQYDALVMPTTPIRAPRFDEISEPAAFGKFNNLALRNTSLFNFLDRCAISLPMTMKDELPAGVMLVGEHLEDTKLLSVALGIEQALAG